MIWKVAPGRGRENWIVKERGAPLLLEDTVYGHAVLVDPVVQLKPVSVIQGATGMPGLSVGVVV